MGYNGSCDNRRQQVSRFAGIIRLPVRLPREAHGMFWVATAVTWKVRNALASLLLCAARFSHF